MNWTIDLCVSEHLNTAIICYLICYDFQLAMLAIAGEDVVDSFIHYIMITYSHYYTKFCIMGSVFNPRIESNFV